MAYFKINGVDYSKYVNKLKITTDHIHKSMTNAMGNTVVKYVNTKHIIDVGIIPLDDDAMSALQQAINQFKVSISYQNPETKELREGVACIIPTNNVEYYTIRADKVQFKAFNLKFEEL